MGLSIVQARLRALLEWYLIDGSGTLEGGLLRLPPKLRRKGPKQEIIHYVKESPSCKLL
jgi:hypothetical protein